MGQMRVEGGQKQRNLARAEERIAEAAAGGANVVLLPECMDLGWTHPSSLTQAEPVPDGAPCRRLSQAAATHGVYVCSGLTEKASDGRVYNAAVLIDHQGRVRSLHRKLNELTIGHPYYCQGDRLGVVETEWGTFGVLICADSFAQDRVISRALCYMGADVLLSPSAWAVPADHDNVREPYGGTWRSAYQPVAREFSVWIAGASNVGAITGGPWEGWRCIGCSLAIAPDGREAAFGPYGADAEAILYVDVEPVPRPARGCGWHEEWAKPKQPQRKTS